MNLLSRALQIVGDNIDTEGTLGLRRVEGGPLLTNPAPLPPGVALSLSALDQHWGPSSYRRHPRWIFTTLLILSVHWSKRQYYCYWCCDYAVIMPLPHMEEASHAHFCPEPAWGMGEVGPCGAPRKRSISFHLLQKFDVLVVLRMWPDANDMTIKWSNVKSSKTCRG